MTPKFGDAVTVCCRSLIAFIPLTATKPIFSLLSKDSSAAHWTILYYFEEGLLLTMAHLRTESADEMMDFGWTIPITSFYSLAVFLFTIFIVIKILVCFREKSRGSDSQHFLLLSSCGSCSRRSREESMTHGFSKSVELVAKQVRSTSSRNHEAKHSTTLSWLLCSCLPRPKSASPPVTGQYKCVTKHQKITSLRNNKTLFGDEAPVTFTLHLTVQQQSAEHHSNTDSDDEFVLTGWHQDELGRSWRLEEGFFQPRTGQAYWVEQRQAAGDEENHHRILVHGHFDSPQSFQGEWMDDQGVRGRFSECHLISTKPEIVCVGVPVVKV